MAGRFFELAWNLTGKIDPSLSRATSQVAQKFSDIGNSAGKLKSVVGGTLGGIAKLGALLTGGAFAAGGFSFSQLANNAAAFGNELNTISSSLGISASSLSNWLYAAEKSEVSSETFKTSISKLNKTISEAAKGSETAQLAFKRVGVSIYDSAGKFKSTDQLMMEMADTFASMPDGFFKADLAMALFGESGAKMVPLMQEGSKSIRELHQEAAELGFGFSDEDIKAAAELQGNWDTLAFTMRGLALTIGKKLLPIISPLVQSMTEWIGKNKELINTKIDQAINLFVKGISLIREYLPPVISFMQGLISKVNDFVEYAGGWDFVLTTIASTFFAIKAIPFAGWLLGVTKAFAGVGWAVLKAIPSILSFSLALLSSPITWVVAGIGLLVAAGIWLYKNWDKVVGYIQGLWDRFKNYISNAVNNIVSIFDNGFIQGVVELFKRFNPVTLVAKGINEVIVYLTGVNLIEQGASLVNSFLTGIKNLWGSITDYFDTSIKDVLSAFDDGFINGCIKVFEKFNPVTIVSKAINEVIKYFTGIDMIQIGSDFIQSFADGLMAKWDLIKDDIIETVTGWMPEWITGGSSSGNSVEIPAYATGGLVTKPEIALIGEDGPEMVIPLTKPNGKDLLAKAANIMGVKGDDTNAAIASSFVSSTQSNNMTVNPPVFSPVINISGADDKTAEKVEQTIKKMFNDFKRQMDEFTYQQSRIKI